MGPNEKPFPKDIRYVDYISRDKWVNPLWTAVKRAIEEQRIPSHSKTQEQKARNLGLSVTLKREYVRKLLGLLRPCLGKLKEFLNNTHLPEPDIAIRVPTDIRHNILVFIDALIFELQSAIELTEQVAKFCLSLTSLPGKARAEWVKERFDGQWRNLITDARHIYTHESAPYFDIDFDHVPNYDLLLIVKHPKERKEPSDYIRLSDLDEAIQEMFAAADKLCEEVVRVLDDHNL